MKDGINALSSTVDVDAVNPEQFGTGWRRTTSSTCRPARSHHPAATPLSSADAEPFDADFDEVLTQRERRSRRVLRDHHLSADDRRPAQRRAPGVRRPALVQTILLVRRRAVALGARCRSVRAQWRTQRSPQHAVAAPRRRRRHLHARQMGVPVVRGLGPRVSRGRAGAVDPDFAKLQLKLLLRHEYLHPNGQLPAYEWSFDDVNPPVHAWAAYFIYNLERIRDGQGRPPFPALCVREAAAQFHLVAQSQGSRRQQRLPGRLPGARQHRHLRSQPAAAHRRQPGAGRRHRLDGLLLPDDAGDRPRAGARRAPLRGNGGEVPGARAAHRRRAGSRRRHRRAAVGRRGRLLLRRAPLAGRNRDASEGALAGRPAAAVRGRRRTRPRPCGRCRRSCSTSSGWSSTDRSWRPR